MSFRSHIVNMQNPFAFARMAVAFLKLVRDPSKLDEVFAILDRLENGPTGEKLVREFADNPLHREVFVRRPKIGRVDLEALEKLPEGTLGRTFADDIRQRGLNLDDVQRRPDDGSEASFVFNHLRGTHDIWHTVTGFDVDVAGELGLQAFYLTQFTAHLSLMILALGILNTLFFAIGERQLRMDEIARGWRMGRKSRPFFGFDWAAHWETPLVDVRAMLGLEAEDVTRRSELHSSRTLAMSPLSAGA